MITNGQRITNLGIYIWGVAVPGHSDDTADLSLGPLDPSSSSSSSCSAAALSLLLLHARRCVAPEGTRSLLSASLASTWLSLTLFCKGPLVHHHTARGSSIVFVDMVNSRNRSPGPLPGCVWVRSMHRAHSPVDAAANRLCACRAWPAHKSLKEQPIEESVNVPKWAVSFSPVHRNL